MGTQSQAEALPPIRVSATVSPVLQKLTVDLTAVRAVLQGRQLGEHSAGSSRLHDLYWQAMKALGVQCVLGAGGDAGGDP